MVKHKMMVLDDNKLILPVIDKPKPNVRNANLYLIRAAIEQATGVKLKIKDVMYYLVTENMITEAQGQAMLFDNYDHLYYRGSNQQVEKLEPIDKIIKESDVLVDEDLIIDKDNQ